MEAFFRFILIGLHFIASFFLFLVDIVSGLKKVLSDVVCFRLPAQKDGKLNEKTQIELLKSSVKCMTKLPDHFVLLLGEDDVSLADVANIVKWCMVSGIRYVSVYDHEGVIKKSINSLEETLESSNKNGPIEDKTTVCLRDQLNSSNSSDNNTGCEKHKVCYVTLLSSLDGRNGIVHSAVDVAQKVIRKCLDVTNFEFPDLETKLINADICPYPNLLVCCGKIRSTIGFLPWHLHLTEILNYETHHHFTLEMFVNTLMKYSNCEQRLGK